ncbi:MAG: uracil-xanthine permease [Roseburia sp.]|nr:uracil-xanthine permease [Roseburia sp.]
MQMIYGVKDRPKTGRLLLFALQQLLAILAATIAVPTIVGNGMSQSAALFGAGVGTIVYLLFTKFKSPVFLGSSFAFIGSMSAAFAGGVSMSLGYLGLLIGAVFAGLVYVIISVVVKFAGVKWIDKVMPAVVIGPTVAIIGLSLAGNAIKDLVSSGYYGYASNLGNGYVMDTTAWLCLICGLVTLGVTIVCSVYGKKMMKMIPFIIGILAGYAVAAIFTGFSYINGAEAMRIINFETFKTLGQGSAWYPDFAFLTAFNAHGGGYGVVDETTKVFTAYSAGQIGAYIGTVAVAYIPVALVVFAEHLADHKNISSIIEHDLLKDPGLHRTLLGDGVGSIAGAFFGGCPNTTYGESVGCVAISRNASVITIFVTACMAILSAFLAPFTLFLASIPNCVMGGVCIALYGFIAVSGLKMIQKVDLNDNRNLFTVCVILIAGVGGMALSIGGGNTPVKLTEVACALILGILVNLLVNVRRKDVEASATATDNGGEVEANAAAEAENAKADEEAAAASDADAAPVEPDEDKAEKVEDAEVK